MGWCWIDVISRSKNLGLNATWNKAIWVTGYFSLEVRKCLQEICLIWSSMIQLKIVSWDEMVTAKTTITIRLPLFQFQDLSFWINFNSNTWVCFLRCEVDLNFLCKIWLKILVSLFQCLFFFVCLLLFFYSINW